MQSRRYLIATAAGALLAAGALAAGSSEPTRQARHNAAATPSSAPEQTHGHDSGNRGTR